MLPYAGLVRVSHMGDRKQGADDFHSERDQIATIKAEAAKRGGRVEILPSELGVSGGLPLAKRPSLLEAVEGVEQGRYRGVIVAYLSRLGRDVEGGLYAWRRIEEAGGQVIVVQESIDTSTPSGRFMRNTYLNVATMEREQHVERFDNLREWATTAGIWQRRQTPRGYRKDDITRKLVPDSRADEVQRAFADRAADTVTIVELADRLQMTPSGVRMLLKNRVYLGELRVGEHVNPAAHPPLVDERTFLLAQRSRPRPARSKNDKSPALLAGLVRCSGCGHVMTRKTSPQRGKAWYSCPVIHSGGRCPEPATIALPMLDEYVTQVAVAHLALLDVASTDSTPDVAKLDIDIANAELELHIYLEAVSAADVGAEAFGAGARKRQAKVSELRALREDALMRTGGGPSLAGGVEAWESLTVRGRNEVLRSLLAAVVVRKVGRGVVVPVADRARVVAAGTELDLPIGAGHLPSGIRPLPFPDADSPSTLGVLSVQ